MSSSSSTSSTPHRPYAQKNPIRNQRRYVPKTTTNNHNNTKTIPSLTSHHLAKGTVVVVFLEGEETIRWKFRKLLATRRGGGVGARGGCGGIGCDGVAARRVYLQRGAVQAAEDGAQGFLERRSVVQTISEKAQQSNPSRLLRLKMVMRDDDSRSLHFFQPLMPGFSKKLAVPTGFVKRIMKERCSTKTATLVSPNGEQWHVDIRKDNKQHDIYFCGHGWLKFVHAHSLGLGYFLVFCYRGNMMFDVRAFDLSTCEITSYASSDAHKEDSCEELGNAKTEKEEKITIKVENEQSDDDINVIENNESIEEAEKTSEVNEEEFENVDKDDEDEIIEKKKRSPEIKIEDLEESDEFTPKKKRKTTQEKIWSNKKSDKFANKRLERDTNYNRRMTTQCHERKKRNNWSCRGEKASFEVTIWRCNVYSPYLDIPWGFSDAGGLTEHSCLTLKDPKGRSWPVRLTHRRTLFGNPRNRSCMTKGWQEFAVANDLKEGDNCRFELASEGNNGKVAMQVEIWKKVV